MSQFDWIPHAFGTYALVTVIYFLAWIWNFAALLRREDIEPITKLTWVVVLIFVPLVVLVLYWIQGPKNALVQRPRYAGQQGDAPFPTGPDVKGTPWETNPGHQR